MKRLAFIRSLLVLARLTLLATSALVLAASVTTGAAGDEAPAVAAAVATRLVAP